MFVFCVCVFFFTRKVQNNEDPPIFCVHSTLKLSDYICAQKTQLHTKMPFRHWEKKVILSLSLWTHQTFKGFLSVVQRWTELICSVRDTHLNLVWMKVNTFTLVTTVCIKTEKQLGPGRHACTVGKFRGAQIPAWFPSHTVNPLSLSVIFSSGLLNESIK